METIRICQLTDSIMFTYNLAILKKVVRNQKLKIKFVFIVLIKMSTAVDFKFLKVKLSGFCFLYAKDTNKEERKRYNDKYLLS